MNDRHHEQRVSGMPKLHTDYERSAPSLRAEGEAIHGRKPLDRHGPDGPRDDDVGRRDARYAQLLLTAPGCEAPWPDNLVSLGRALNPTLPTGVRTHSKIK